MDPLPHAAPRGREPGFVPLFWRLFAPNATVLAVACVALWIEPANGRILALAGGLVMLLAVNWTLMRRAVTPLRRLASVMEEVDPLEPGRRVEVDAPPSEVTVLARAFNDMLERVERERRDSARRGLAREQEERRRLSRELHDEIGQSLTAHVLHLDRVLARADGRLADDIGAARDGALEVVDQLREVAQSLRPDVLDNIGLASALAGMVDRATVHTSLRVLRRLESDLPDLDQDVRLAVYRVAQEAITNAVRHAEASEVALSLGRAGDRVRLEVVDNGAGIGEGAVEASVGGLRGMRERALVVRGRLTIARVEPTGSRIRLDVPVHPGGR